MKQLLRVLSLAALVAGIVWLLRDRLVPAPETTPEEPPHYRVPPPPPPESPAAAEADDLTELRGVGPVYAARLAGAGYPTFAALAAADADQVADAIGGRPDQAADWIEQAQGLAG